jgi:hypothetical protein
MKLYEQARKMSLKEEASEMTRQQAREFGAISVKEFKTGKIEAVFTSLRTMAEFRSELSRRNIQFTDHFAMAGRALKFKWTN